MKKNYATKFVTGFTFFLCCFHYTSEAQMFYIPDLNFRNVLVSRGYSTCIVGDSIDSSDPIIVNTTVLDVSGYSIQSLEGIQAFSNLQELRCQYNLLTNLPSLPAQLIQLNCQGNQLTSLPALPGTLTRLDCSFNNLTGLPSLPASLTYLVCENNQLTSLPLLPGALMELGCYLNQLTGLPSLPASLTSLNCENNQLTNLPTLPNSLTGLICNFNQLTTLPALPASLIDIECTNNQLVSLPEFPDTMHYFSCSNNPNLNCLPRLKRMMYLMFFGTSITCRPNSGNVTASNPPLSSVPLCDFFNSNGCNFYWNIRGLNYLDADSNCVFNSNDTGQTNAHILLYKDGNLQRQIFTSGGGFYSFDLEDTGSYEVRTDTVGLPFDLLCPSTNSYHDTITQTDSLFDNNDFAFKCKPGFDVGVRSVFTWRFRPANNSIIYVGAGDAANFYGAHCALGVSGTLRIYFNGPVTYVGPAAGAMTPTVSGDTLIYSVADFGALNYSSDFNFILHTDSAAVIGSTVCITAVISSPLAGDYNSSNDTLVRCFMVRNAFDPNAKEVDPEADLDPAGNKWLTFTIRFQNTGTASAEHVYITDTLDQDLDLSTFQLLAYSHQPLVQVLNDGIARFNFPNINLPDSNTNELASHGYIQYKIRLKNGLPLGTEISNTAYIYFDFNAPVVTNTTRNTLQLPLHVASLSQTDFPVFVYPNPSRSEFTVYCLRFTTADKVMLKLYDAVGQLVISEKILSPRYTLQTSALPPGIYFLKIESQNGVAMKKVVKE